jgi:aryl-alcohol dehydrogenase-like predicted oxidoreductase
MASVEENVGAADVQLTSDELDRIESAFPKGATTGDRYPDMSTVNG